MYKLRLAALGTEPMCHTKITENIIDITINEQYNGYPVIVLDQLALRRTLARTGSDHRVALRHAM